MKALIQVRLNEKSKHRISHSFSRRASDLLPADAVIPEPRAQLF